MTITTPFYSSTMRGEVAPQVFADMRSPIPAALQGKVAAGYLDLYSPKLNGKVLEKADINEFLKAHSASFGITRSGKSNGIGRFCEEMLLKGVKLLILDYYGEHKTIAELRGFKLKILQVIGRDGRADAQEFSKKEESLLLSLESTKDSEYLPYLADFFDELWEQRRHEKEECEKDGTVFTMIKLVVEEAHQFIPQNYPKSMAGMPKELQVATRNLKGSFRSIARQGLGTGISLHLISQRPTYVEMSVRSQCNVFLLYRQGWENDIEVYMSIIPVTGTKNDKNMREEAIKNLPTGRALFIYSGARIQEVQFKVKRSRDLRQTSGWEEYVLKQEAMRHEWQHGQRDNISGGSPA